MVRIDNCASTGNTVYLVVECSGEWEDYRECTRGVFTSRDKAVQSIKDYYGNDIEVIDGRMVVPSEWGDDTYFRVDRLTFGEYNEITPDFASDFI